MMILSVLFVVSAFVIAMFVSIVFSQARFKTVADYIAGGTLGVSTMIAVIGLLVASNMMYDEYKLTKVAQAQEISVEDTNKVDLICVDGKQYVIINGEKFAVSDTATVSQSENNN